MFTPISMGTVDRLGIDTYVPLTTKNFEVRVYNLDGTTPTEFSDLLTLSTDSIGAVQENQDIITVYYMNGSMKFPSRKTFAEVDWTLNCFCDPPVLDSLRGWSELIQSSRNHKMGLPSEYGRTVYFIKYDGQGNTRDVIKCPFTWIGALNNGDMSHSSDDIVKVSVPFVISAAQYLTKADWAA